MTLRRRSPLMKTFIILALRSFETSQLTLSSGDLAAQLARARKHTAQGGDEQLEAVEVSYHGDRIIWDDIGQRYHISDLKQGIYIRSQSVDGRP